MERNVMGELNVYRGSGAKPNFSEIARRHGMDRHTVAKYWREGESAADGRSAVSATVKTTILTIAH